MKKKILVFSLLSLLFIFAAVAGNKKEGDAQMRFTEYSYDFGNISDKKPVTHEFKYYNDGFGNLVVIDAKAECGCTKPKFSKKPTAPGKSGTITVTFNPSGRTGGFKKNITITTNSKKSPKQTLTITGNIVSK